MFEFTYRPPIAGHGHVIEIPAMVVFKTPLEEKINNFCNGNIYHNEEVMCWEFDYENLIKVINFMEQRGGTLINWKEIVIMLAKRVEHQNV